MALPDDDLLVATAVPAAGVVVFIVLALLDVSVVVLLILRHYLPLRSTPAFYLVPIFFALWLPAGVLLLVPIDLASSARTEDEATRGIWLPQRALLVSWRITYWLTFALTWYVAVLLVADGVPGVRRCLLGSGRLLMPV